MSEPDSFDKRNLRRSFERAANTYDQVAGLQRQVADELMSRLDYIRLNPKRIIDAGTGTGYCSRALASRYRRAEIISLDIADSMLREARAQAARFFSREHWLCADIHKLPLPDACADLVVSNLTLQWSEDLETALAELTRVLRPGGLILFATFGPDTLTELRQAWAAADSQPHVNNFLDMHDVGDRMMTAGLRDVVMDVDRLTTGHHRVESVFRDLRELGAHNVLSGRQRGLTGKNSWQAMVSAYEQQRSSDGTLPVTHEIVYAHAWAPDPLTVGFQPQYK